MRIVVLDGHTLNPNDLSWNPLEEFGMLKVYPRTKPEQVLKRAKGVEILLTNKVQLTESIIESLPELKYIGLLATGYDNVDVEAARKRGVLVTNIPRYGTASVAQHTFALILQLANRVGIHNISVKDMEWTRGEDFSYFKVPLIELEGKRLGIIGSGAIGRKVAEIGAAFGMKILVHSSHAKSTNIGQLHSLEFLFKESDFITIHTSLKEDNVGLVNKDLLQYVKPTAYLINTSRGAIVNEQDLADALNNNKIAGAALDVLSKEPPPENNPLLSAKNCIITPHIAWVTREARQRLIDTVVDNIRSYLKGEPKNRVH